MIPSGRMLSREEELDVIERAKAGDQRAIATLIKSHMRLIRAIARRNAGLYNTAQDVISEGMVGLMRALEKFDPERGYRFSTVARWWVRAAIQEYVISSARQCGVCSSKQWRTMIQNGSTISRMICENGWEEAAEHVGLTVQILKGSGIFSQDAPSLPWHEHYVVRDTAATPEETAEESSETEHNSRVIQEALGYFTPREQRLIHLRYLQEEPARLSDIAEEFGVSVERIRQIDARCISRLRGIIETLAR